MTTQAPVDAAFRLRALSAFEWRHRTRDFIGRTFSIFKMPEPVNLAASIQTVSSQTNAAVNEGLLRLKSLVEGRLDELRGAKVDRGIFDLLVAEAFFKRPIVLPHPVGDGTWRLEPLADTVATFMLDSDGGGLLSDVSLIPKQSGPPMTLLPTQARTAVAQVPLLQVSHWVPLLPVQEERAAMCDTDFEESCFQEIVRREEKLPEWKALKRASAS